MANIFNDKILVIKKFWNRKFYFDKFWNCLNSKITMATLAIPIAQSLLRLGSVCIITLRSPPPPSSSSSPFPFPLSSLASPFHFLTLFRECSLHFAPSQMAFFQMNSIKLLFPNKTIKPFKERKNGIRPKLNWVKQNKLTLYYGKEDNS